MVLLNRHKSDKGLIAVLLVLGFILMMFIPLTLIYIPTVIMSESMEPALNIGDVVFIQNKIVFADTKTGTDGDILMISNYSIFTKNGVPSYMYAHLNVNTPIIHRAIEKREINGTWYFVTQGDNNPYPDGCIRYSNEPNSSYCVVEFNSSDPVLIPEDYIRGKVVFILPFFGYFKIFSREILIHVIVAFIVMLAYHLKKKGRAHEQTKYIIRLSSIE